MNPTEVYGCPFKTMDATSLRNFLKQYYIKDDRINNKLSEIINIKSNYTEACTMTFNFSYFNMKETEQGYLIPKQQYTSEKVSTYPVRFSLKAMEICNLEVDQGKKDNAFKNHHPDEMLKDNNI